EPPAVGHRGRAPDPDPAPAQRKGYFGAGRLCRDVREDSGGCAMMCDLTTRADLTALGRSRCEGSRHNVSLPPCGGGTGRGVAAGTESVVTPSPPLPQKGGGSRPSPPPRVPTTSRITANG